MDYGDPSAQPIALAVRPDGIVSVVEAARTRIADAAETVALYLMVCAFWGLILYLALTYAL